jgi:hypothetical protein
VELTGNEQLENGNFVNASEKDSGTFVVRSLRHGRRKPLKKGQVCHCETVILLSHPLFTLMSLIDLFL